MALIRPMTAADAPTVERLLDAVSAAWRTHFDPSERLAPGKRLVTNRFHKDPGGCFVAEDAATGLAGAALSIAWGSIGWLGPVAVHPDSWGTEIETQLLRAVLEHWEPMALSAQGAETFPNSPAHIQRYAALGFRPQFPTAHLVGEVDPAGPRQPIRQRTPSFELIRLSQLSDALEETMLSQCRRIAERHYPGLDYGKELQSVKERGLGDTLLLGVGERLYGFAICHAGDASEADSTECYVKALLIDPAIDDAETLLALVEACEGYARMQHLATVRVGLNLACWEGYMALAERGYHMERLRLRMVRPVDELMSDPSPFHFNDWQ
jgi:N-acetylglutamate synthase-like GNAT family acetyltransferase